MLVFAEVVDAGSFSAAAQRLGVSKASVSRSVALLERTLGAQLLRRTTRRMSLTDIGEVFFARCQRLVEEVEGAEQSVGELQSEPRGLIRLAAPMSFGHREVAPRLPAFLARHPRVRIHLDLTDRFVDLVREKFDLAIRVSGRLEESSLVRRLLCPLALTVCAAPSYLAQRGTPREPEALRDHECLSYGLTTTTWSFSRGRRIAVSGALTIDNGDALRQVALEGHGIVYLPTFLVAEDLRTGRLVSILARHVDAKGGAFAVYPESRHLSPKVRALIDALVASFETDPTDRGRSTRSTRSTGAATARPRSAAASRARADRRRLRDSTADF